MPATEIAATIALVAARLLGITFSFTAHNLLFTRQMLLRAKVREARLARVNYFAVVGAKEAETGSVALQNQAGEKLGTIPVDEFVARMQAEIDEKRLPASMAKS